jgi:hypothetical protein
MSDALLVPFDRSAALVAIARGEVRTVAGPRATRHVQHVVLAALVAASDENAYAITPSLFEFRAMHGLDER